MTLPKGWAQATIHNVAEIRATKSDPAELGDLPFIGLEHIEAHTSRLVSHGTAEDVRSMVARFNKGDVLFGRLRPYLNKVIQASFDGCASAEIIPFAPTAGILSSLLKRHMMSEDFLAFTASLDRGDRPRVKGEEVNQYPLLIPPIPEQRRIVAKLDALTAHIARARAELDRVPVLAENLRQSAVVTAFGGKLTAEWRMLNTEHAQSDEELEASFYQIATTKRRKPVAAIDWKPDLEISESWRWVSVDQVIAVTQYGTSSKTTDVASGVPVLRMGNIQHGELDWANLKFLPSTHHEFPDLLLSAGDVLFNRTNSFELVGKSTVFRGRPEPVSFASYLIRLKCSAIIPDLLVRYLNSPIGKNWISQVASQQVGQANVNGTKLKSLGIPLPPMSEQIEIDRLLTSAFARADRLEAEATRARALLDRLESGILAKAFRGELVPQDPNDEPANVLLERIRAQRAVAPKSKRSRATAEA